MASAVKPNKNQGNTEPVVSQDKLTTDVQSYLISNYREALKRGDKSAAKSCLLAARYFSVNDPNVTNEIYIMAKTDGDVSEASKCFANIFNDLFASDEQNTPKTQTNESTTVINQMKEEIKILLGELKSQYLKLKSLPIPATLASRQVPSVQHSPLLSPRMRLSSEDRFASRESMTKLDSHLYTSTRGFFYQQLFDNLPEETRKSILDHSIETCENPFENCRLMMLAMSIFNDSVSNYGSRLLRNLIELSEPGERSEMSRPVGANPAARSPLMCRYAKSLLVLDAIPLVFGILPSSNLTLDVFELLEKTLNFYSERCIETSATEYESNELHEGVKKSIAARILGTENNVSEETYTEDGVISTLNLLIRRFIESLTDTSIIEKFETVRTILAGKSQSNTKIDQILELLKDLNIEDEIPDEFLFASKDDSSSSQSVSTPPPKSRGRPKKAQQQSVIVSLDDGVKRHLQNKSREVQFIFYSIVQCMFVDCAAYLKRTRSRILMNFDNPLVSSLKTELAKSSTQRTSRSKAGTQQSNDTSSSANKKQKLDKQCDRLVPGPNFESSPLNSEHNRLLDLQILLNLQDSFKCLQFLTSNNSPFTKLWQKFLTSNNITNFNWFRRFSIDGKLMSGQHDELADAIDSIFNEEENNVDVKPDIDLPVSASTLITGQAGPPTSVLDLRNLVGAVSCNVQRLDKVRALELIEELLTRMKQCGLMDCNENYLTGNSIDEYLINVHDFEPNNLGFLFFDSLSIIRYCVDISMSLIRLYATNSNTVTDHAVGHAIVLSQFDWPKEFSTYDQCLTWLRVHKPKSTTPQCLSAATKFTYLDFFLYIRNPNIIEDFMAMLSQGYTLDIKGSHAPANYISQTNSSNARATSSQSATSNSRQNSSASTSRSGKAITTRGVNKTFKEDLKIALIAQMKASSVLISLEMISEFMQVSLIPYLKSSKK